MARKPLFKYDTTSGHYVRILEADTTTQTSSSFTATSDDTEKTTTTSTSQTSGDTSTGTSTGKSIETNTQIQQLNTDLEQENKSFNAQKTSIESRYNNDKAAQQGLLNAAMRAAAESTDTAGDYDSVQTNASVLAIKKKILDIDLQYAQNMSRIQLQHAQNVNNIENNKLSILSKLNNEGLSRLPSKYIGVINESNIGQAKVYVDGLIGDERPIAGMVDFKRVMCESGLVYGKDSTGYYMLCIDEDDMNKAFYALMSAGYAKDEVMSAVLPQMLDRSCLITATPNK